MEQVKQYVVADGLIDLGVKGGTFVRLDDYAALQQKLDAVLAKGMELAQEAAHVYAEYNKEMAPDVVCDGQTIQEFHDLANGWSSVESYLNEMRAEGAIAVRDALVLAEEGADLYSIATQTAAQLRAGSTEGGV